MSFLGFKNAAEKAKIGLAAARDQLRTLIVEKATANVRAKFDRLDSNDLNNENRRTPSVEILPEDRLETTRNRLKAINIGRDLYRNSSQAKGMAIQFECNVVGAEGPKVAFHWENKEQAKQAGRYFNSTFSKGCDGRDDTPLQEFCAMALNAVKREGEILCVFDDFQFDDGKLLWYEADQLPSLDEAKWKAMATDAKNGDLFVELGANGQPLLDSAGKMIPLRAIPGRVINRRGKVVYYICDEQHGRQDVDPNDTDILFVGRAAAKLIKKPWRFGQLIGQSEQLTASADIEDVHQLRQAEINSAKKVAKRAFSVMSDTAYEDELARLGIDVEDEISTGTATTDAKAKSATAERLEQYADGYVDYMGAKDVIHEWGSNRPSPNVQHVYELVGNSAGASLGLAAVYTNLKASTSYTAFRGEMILSWLKFRADQKWLERRLLDWLVVKAIGWASRKGLLDFTLPENWEDSFSFVWPEMPEVDEGAIATARAKNLKNGFTDYAKILGPDWEARLMALADQLKIVRANLPEMEILETKAGAPTNGAQDEQN